jgi:acetyl-CoA C-acetyltransferase
VSRFAKGTSDHIPDTKNPLFADAAKRTEEYAKGGQDWHDPREDGLLPDIYIAMGQTAENVARLRGLGSPRARRVRRTLAEPCREGDQRRFLGTRDHPGHAGRRHGRLRGRRHRARARPSEGHLRQLQPVFRPDGAVTAGNCLPAQRRRRRRGRHDVGHQGCQELGLTPLARIVSSSASVRPRRRRSWASARSRRSARRWHSRSPA